MIVKHELNNSEGKFYLESDGKEVGEMTYRKDSEGNLIIDHTFVDEQLRNKGYAAKMVEAAVKFARNNGIKIIPKCPYVKGKFKEIESYSDVLK